MVTKKAVSNAQRFFDKEKKKFAKTVRANIKRRNAAFTRVRKRRNELIKLKRK